MSGPAADLRDALRAALGDVAARAVDDLDLDRLVAEARADAEAEVRAILRDLFLQRFLDGPASAGERPASRHVAPGGEGGAVETEDTGAATAPGAVSAGESEADPRPATGWYVYGVAPAATVGALQGREGVTGAPVDVVIAGGLAALVSIVDVDDVGGGDGAITEPGWLEARVLAHDDVLRAALDAGPVVPMRFATVVPCREDVERLLDHEGPRLASTLEHLRGRSEWGVKVRVEAVDRDAVVAADPDLRALAAELEAAPPGRAYLLRRRLEQATAARIEDVLDDTARDCNAAVAAVAEATTRLAGRHDTGEPGAAVLDVAALVADDARAELESVVEGLQRRHGPVGAIVQLTGPWPPYSFVEQHDPGAAA